MTVRQQFDSAHRKPRYSKEEFAQRGDEIYMSQVRQQIDEEGNHGKIVAIDIETGAFEVAENTIEATDRLYVAWAISSCGCGSSGSRTTCRHESAVWLQVRNQAANEM